MQREQIRGSVFETNSSSCHSIAINEVTDEFFLDNSLLPDQDGVIELTGGEFGWEFEKINDALTKANYAAVSTLYGFDMDLLIEVIKEQTAADNVVINISEEYGDRNRSYIDHESVHTISELGTKEKLRNFIFNKNCWLFTANDNSTPDPTFYDVPLYKDGKIIKVKYAYELIIDGYEKTTKFKEKPSLKEIREACSSLFDYTKCFSNGTFFEDTSIYAQMSIDSSKLFEFSYKSEVTEKTLQFIKNAWADASKIYKERFPFDKWEDGGYTKTQEIEKELMQKYPEKYQVLINYQLKEL